MPDSATAAASALVALLGERYHMPPIEDPLEAAEWLQMDGQEDDPDYRALVGCLRVIYGAPAPK